MTSRSRVPLAATRVRFRSPSGARDDDPRLDVLRELLLAQGPSYWNTGSGDAGLIREQGPSKAFLVLQFSVRFGFHFKYQRRMGHLPWLSPRSPRASISQARMVIGGEPTRIPSNLFVPRKQAVEVVEAFLATG